MVEKKYLFLISSVLAIILLSIISQFLHPKILTINQISNKNLNENIQIKAQAEIITEKPGFQLYELEDKTGNLSAISFSKTKINLNSSQTYFFTGKLQEDFYNNTRTLQLIINKINYLSRHGILHKKHQSNKSSTS